MAQPVRGEAESRTWLFFSKALIFSLFPHYHLYSPFFWSPIAVSLLSWLVFLSLFLDIVYLSCSAFVHVWDATTLWLGGLVCQYFSENGILSSPEKGKKNSHRWILKVPMKVQDWRKPKEAERPPWGLKEERLESKHL